MQLTRRQALRAAGGTAAAAAVGPGLLSGCGSRKSKNTTSANRKVKLPTYVPYTGVTADLPGTKAGVSPAFFRYPATPRRGIIETPGRGGSVQGFANIYAALPPAVGRNAYWQALNKRLGVSLGLQMVPTADYKQKLATAIAGNDLPDLTSLEYFALPAHAPDVLAHEFTDLSEYVSGDAVKDYPFLANLPTGSWKYMVFNGGIYGVPLPRSPIGSIFFVREDIVRKKGLSLQPKSFAEFRELCRGLTDRNHNKFALAGGPADAFMPVMMQMVGQPNAWIEDGGKFTNSLETDEMRKALDGAHTLFKDGSMHPDTISATSVQRKQWLYSGIAALNQDGYKGWTSDILATLPDSEHRLGAMVLPAFDGGQGTHGEGDQTFAIVAIKKAKKSRVEEMLRLLNWFAAPFGTEEYLLRKYGVAGTDFTRHGTDPILTDRGVGETALPINYLADGPDVIYVAGKPGVARKQHEFFTKQIPLIKPNPQVGLYSNTDSGKGVTLNTIVVDLQNQVIQGRKSLSDWDEGVKAWQHNGGNTIKDEYAQSYQEIHGG